MDFEINGKLYEVKLNTRAVKKLDKRHKIEEQGMKFSMGAAFAHIALEQKSISELSYVLQASTKGNHREDVIDDAIDEYGDKHGTIKGLYEELLEELGKSPITKDTIEEFLGNLENQEED